MMRTSFLLLALMGLSGCLTSTEAPPTTYTMRYDAPVITGAESGLSGTMIVPEPALPPGLETERIALYLANGRNLDYYAGAEWPESLDLVLQDIIVQGGRQALPGIIVDTPDLDIPADYQLSVKANEFAPFYAAGPDGVPQLRIALTFTLIRLPEQEMVTDFTLESGEMAAANTITAVVTGLEGLLRAMLQQAYARMEEHLKGE